MTKEQLAEKLKAYCQGVYKTELEHMLEQYGDPEDYTCHTCTHKDTCKYAYDFYNTGGDCLAEK